MVFEDEAGQSLRPPKARTWSRRGRTPVVKVTGRGSGRVSLAALVCAGPGRRSRLIYRMLVHTGRKGEKKGFREDDFAALLDAAHQQLDGKIVLVWDNATQHKDAVMRELLEARSTWLTVFRLPPYFHPRNRTDPQPTPTVTPNRKPQKRYAVRSGIEGTICEFAHGHGMRRCC